MRQSLELLRAIVLVSLSVACLEWPCRPGYGAGGPLPPNNLKCEYLSDPLGIDVRQSRFAWALEHTERGERQSAYQILVATRPELLAQDQGNQWDTGKVSSAQSTQVVYAGKPVESGRTYYWKVRTWDAQGNASPYSRAALFEMGLLSPAEWKAQWIAGGNELRKEFSLPSRVVRARAYVTALGYYELRLNGRKVGTNILDPAWTTYEKRSLYVTYDVTSQLQQGANAVGVMLGNGWAVLPKRAGGDGTHRERRQPNRLGSREVRARNAGCHRRAEGRQWERIPCSRGRRGDF
jgi:alpha-L-rhamnosidase